MSPVQCAVVLKALEIVASPEGTARRERMLKNAESLRQGLSKLGKTLIGTASPIIPFVAGKPARARLIAKHLFARGALVNMVEYPAVARSGSRFRLQVMADHTQEQIDRFLLVLQDSVAAADEELSRFESQQKAG